MKRIKRYYRCKPDTGGNYVNGQFCIGVVTQDRMLMFYEHPSPITRKMIKRILRRVRKGHVYHSQLLQKGMTNV